MSIALQDLRAIQATQTLQARETAQAIREAHKARVEAWETGFWKEMHDDFPSHEKPGDRENRYELYLDEMFILDMACKALREGLSFHIEAKDNGSGSGECLTVTAEFLNGTLHIPGLSETD